MNNSELTNFRKTFYENLEEFIKENDKLEEKHLYKILRQSISDTKIESEHSKKILFYLGTYAQEIGKYSTKEYLTYEDNVKAKYRLYIDIETGMTYKSLIKDVKKFEEHYTIIKVETDINNVQEYNKKYEKVRLKYFRNLLYNSQNTSLKLVKTDIKENNI